MAKGQAAPFDGQLLSVPLAIVLGQKANGCAAVTGIEVSRAVQLVRVDLDLARRYHEIDNEAAAAREAAFKKAVETARPKWYESPIFVSVISVTATVALVVATGYSLRRL